MKTLRRFWEEHPQLTMWIVLAIGMVVIMIWAARSVGFTASQWAWLIVVTIGLAGVCTWIISWGEDYDEEECREEEAEQEPKQESANESEEEEAADQ